MTQRFVGAGDGQLAGLAGTGPCQEPGPPGTTLAPLWHRQPGAAGHPEHQGAQAPGEPGPCTRGCVVDFSPAWLLPVQLRQRGCTHPSLGSWVVSLTCTCKCVLATEIYDSLLLSGWEKEGACSLCRVRVFSIRCHTYTTVGISSSPPINP